MRKSDHKQLDRIRFYSYCSQYKIGHRTLDHGVSMTERPPRKLKMSGTTARNIVPLLRKEILAGALAAGTPLRQDELAGRFNVSKIPVREALRQLESEGLVEFRPRRGAIVVELTPEDFAEMFDLRIALECRALELAVPNMVEADLRFARDILDDYVEAGDFERWSDLNLRFHLALYEPCNRHRLLRMIRQLHDQMGLFRTPSGDLGVRFGAATPRTHKTLGSLWGGRCGIGRPSPTRPHRGVSEGSSRLFPPKVSADRGGRLSF